MNTCTTLEKTIGYTFKNKALLIEALTHRSYKNENRKHPVAHNERLEFLGDAVLELVVTDHIWLRYPKENEGTLTEIRSHLVNHNHMRVIGEALGINEHLLLSRGESKDMKSRGLIIANALEAIIGAIYRDDNLAAAEAFIKKFFLSKLETLGKPESLRDAKSLLQEVAQEHTGITPHYRVVKEHGPDHDKTFHIVALIGEMEIGKGAGPSKFRAEMEAASDALANILSTV